MAVWQRSEKFQKPTWKMTNKYEKIEELAIIVLDVLCFTLKGTKKFRATLRKKISKPK
jgi:hypothetical protein